MIEKIKGISIEGRCFPEKTELAFFDNKDRIAVVYGKNGSGKSTISHAFSCIGNNDFPDDLFAELLDQTGQEISLSDDAKIYVFNEQYIDENVKVDEDGLGTIILFGTQIDLQAEIDDCIKKNQDVQLKYEKAQSELGRYSESGSIISPNYHYENIRKKLQTEWAKTDSKIKGNKANSKVTDAVVNEICELSFSETLPELKKKFDEGKDLLERISDGSINYPTAFRVFDLPKHFEESICALLSKTIDKPILTERENLILATIQKGKQNFIEDAQKTFCDETISVCPYCYQAIEDDYKRELLKSISRVLNKDVDAHRSELQAVRFVNFSEDYTIFSELDSELVKRIIEKRNVCVKLVEQYQELLQRKQNNIYTPINASCLGLQNAVEELNDLLRKLELRRQEFEAAIKRRNKIRQDLILINKKIAHLQIEQMYGDFQKQKLEMEKAQVEVQKIRDEYNKTSEYLKKLQNRKANVQIAINNINNALDYVFFSHGRLSIELKNDRYYLKSNGKSVKPKNISLGERNIIALCYFFTQILSNQDVSKLYKNEELVVIDDPISSFDFENKVGISSFLRYQANRIVKGNDNSRLLFLTHDLSTFFDIRKIADDIKDKPRTKTFKSFELTGGHLILIEYRKELNEYRELMNMVYQYASENASELDLSIGNSLRRAMEAFSTFTYGKGIVEVSSDSHVINRLGERSTYFENLMYRLVLHGESHSESRIYAIKDDYNFYQFISPTEKQRTCKDVLCFMYCLNPDHIEAYLPKTISDIENWVKNIPLNSSFELQEEVKNQTKHRTIPLYVFSISAGTGNGIFDTDVARETYETDNEDADFALRVSGDSMQPTIDDGDVILIKSKTDAIDGQIYAFGLNGDPYCKRLVHKNGRTFLLSDNPKYSPIEIHDSDMLVTYGRVIDVISNDD